MKQKRDPNSKSTMKRKAARDRRIGGKSFCYIYGLTDETGSVRYIGQTRCDLSTRFGYHMRNCKTRPSAPLSMWLAKAKRQIVMLDDNATWDVSEVLWIDRYRREGHKLLNVLRGGADNISSVRRDVWRKPAEAIRMTDLRREVQP